VGDPVTDNSWMRTLAVVTDSAADIDQGTAQERGITVVPLSVSFGDETFPDGQLSQQEFFDRMRNASQLPITSQPAIGAFAEAYERALEKADHVISVHISARLSGTIGSARKAAEQFPGRVHVFDSRNLSWGLGWQVLDAAQAASDGLGPDAALVRLARLRDRVKLIVGLDSLDNLARGGRIGKVSAFLGAMLNLKVTLTVDANGEFAPLGRSRGEKAALRHTVEWVVQQMGSSTGGKIAVGHALSLERTHALVDELKARYTTAELVAYEAGSVISTHTGTGWGVAVVPGE
jgi:DegV family protein with EDD domain